LSAKVLLGDVHAQHARQSNRWTAGTFDLRIERLDGFMQLASRHYAVDLGQEPVAPRQFLLGGVFKVGEALLHGQWRTVAIPYCLRSNRSRERCQMNKSVIP